jgi:flagellar protein FliO/FliZ
MQWLNELPFADNRVLQIGFLAACGIAALIVLAIVYRLAFAHRLRVPGGRTRQPRLGLVDAFSLDGQRQLVLIRRDNIEHLVMIGGPNDVLVESQINRAAVPARESAQASPLLVPSTPVRQAPLPAPTSAAAEALAKVTAKAQTPAPALAGATTAAPVTPAAVAPLAPIPASAPPTPPPVPKAPAPAQPLAPSQAFVPAAFVPAQASAPEPARSAVSAAPAATQAAEPARPAPASSPPRQAEPRPAQPRATMPPPILPASASLNRSAPVRVTETAPASAPGNPPSSSPAAPGPSRRPERAEAAAVGSKAEPNVTTVRREPVAASTGTTVPPAGAALAQARPTPRTPSSAPVFDGTQKTVDPHPPGDKMSAASIDKPSPKVEDPFADLDSLEAEMARLLGREKSD